MSTTFPTSSLGVIAQNINTVIRLAAPSFCLVTPRPARFPAQKHAAVAVQIKANKYTLAVPCWGDCHFSFTFLPEITNVNLFGLVAFYRIDTSDGRV